MKKQYVLFVIVALLASCSEKAKNDPEISAATSIEGTWKLLTGTVIEKGDTTITDYTKDKSFIKIINDSHFAFLLHDLTKGKDSSSAEFSAGGGSYSVNGNTYTEHLEYCNAREWEGHDFSFTITISGDTLIQSGVEKIEAQGINRINTEKYVRVKE
ncbi:MAG TPA: hypothetical protein VFH08_08855 [Chitinophagaceae bacterium]|nr:hypothetical protein [Chitinophagaceae bacterium]